MQKKSTPCFGRHLLVAVWPVLMLLALPLLARAQTSPDAGGLLQQQRQPAVPPGPAATSPGVVIAPSVPQAAAPPGAAGNGGPADLRVLVKAFQIQGEPVAFTAEQLLATLAPWRGRTLTLAELNQAVDAVTQLYRDSGYPLARAVLPRQDVTAGTVGVRVLEALADTDEPVRVANIGPVRLKPEQARRLLLGALQPGRPLQRNALERGALLLGDLPGVNARLELEPGRQPGSTRVVAQVQEGPLLSGLVSLDNHGSRYTGAERVGAQLNLNDAAGLGDQATLQASAGAGLSHVRVGYALPVGDQGLRLGLAMGGLDYSVGEQLATLMAGGQARNASLTARYPLRRSASSSVHATAALELSWLRNHANGAETNRKQLQVLNLGLQADHSDAWGGGGSTGVTAGVSLGRLDLSANADSLRQDQADTGPKTQGSFAKLNLSAQRWQVLSPRLSLVATAQAQWASRNLDSAEKLQLGGPSGVRAYPVGEGSGDSGVKASAELRWFAGQVPNIGPAQLQAFVDAGRVRQNQNAQALQLSTPNHYGLAGWGLGAVLSGPQGLEARIGWAQRLGSNPGRSANGLDSDGRSSRSRVWVSLQAAF